MAIVVGAGGGSIDAVQRALRERVKELTCLYGVAQVDSSLERPLAAVLQDVVGLLPPAWQFPDVTTARIRVGGTIVTSAEFRAGDDRIAAAVAILEECRGEVEVFYTSPCPPADEGPFLREERSLIDAVARHIGLICRRRQAEEQRAALEEQLRHADRLATVGQLAAGVAHELNEPLAAVLGYAELIGQSFGLPDRTARDLGKIVKASLHAREIVRALLLFARQVPGSRQPLSLNRVVRDALVLLESRCVKSGVRIALRAAQALPEVIADASQIQQVVLNLCVNAIQSMPRGGTLRVVTEAEAEHVRLVVADEGEGMTEEVRRHLFTPFFTTKSVGNGTGLGLSVVHGIVAGHGGTIEVDSAPGEGATFTVRLPLRPTAGPGAGEHAIG
jgi:nitrogen-specific signal transduction histidine kinase